MECCRLKESQLGIVEVCLGRVGDDVDAKLTTIVEFEDGKRLSLPMDVDYKQFVGFRQDPETASWLEYQQGQIYSSCSSELSERGISEVTLVREAPSGVDKMLIRAADGRVALQFTIETSQPDKLS